MHTEKEQHPAREQYIAPAVEVIEMETENIIAASLSDPGFNDVPEHNPDTKDFWGN